jgi:hypothetical protein
MAAGEATTSDPKSKAIPIAIMVVCLTVAAYLFFSHREAAGEGQLDTAESATTYICPADSTVLNVTPATFEKMLNSGEAGPREGASRRKPGLYLRCPKCAKRIMVIAVKCPKDGTQFAPIDADSKPVACPKCGWKTAEGHFRLRTHSAFAMSTPHTFEAPAGCITCHPSSAQQLSESDITPQDSSIPPGDEMPRLGTL